MNFFKEYFENIYTEILKEDLTNLENAAQLIINAIKKGGKIIIAGNGASASIASHIAIDLTKSANVTAVTFNEANLITCFANDYGYERWVEKAIEFYAGINDMIILISSSGKSKNIVNAALKAKELSLGLITLSGFEKDNPLRQVGDINLWINSKKYNIVEIIHHAWLVAIVDKIALERKNKAR